MSTDPNTGTVTADDVAKLANVSRWTVNRAFKPGASISAKSRARVMAAAEQLGYAPDLLAASLASDRSNLVALLIDDFSNPHKLLIIEQLTRILRSQGWDTLLVNTLNAADAPSALLTASQRRVDAAVLIGIQFNDQELQTALGARRVRKLILFARQSENPNTISICCDDQAAMTTITNYVVDQGYKQPLFVAGPQTTSAHLLRKETFLSHWQQINGQVPAFVPVEAYDPQLSYQAVAQYLRINDAARPDILVCENDALAMGAIDALRYEFNLTVPGDIAVIGFDDVPQAATPQYQLTTYRQPIAEMVHALVDVLKGSADMSTLNRFSGQLVVRNSA